MAKDKVTIFIPNIQESTFFLNEYSFNIKKSAGFWALRQKSLDGERNEHRRLKYIFGSMSSTIGSIFVEYLKYSPDRGDLLLSFSVSELFYYDNAVPKSAINPVELTRMIHTELKCLLDITKLPCWTTWKVTRDETNVDVIDSEENITRRLDIISRSQLPYKNVNTKWCKDGTVYFEGRAGVKSSSKIVVYDKKKEMTSKGKNPNQVIGLGPREGCLRLEVKTSKNPLRRLGKKTVFALNLPDSTFFPHLYLFMGEDFQFLTIMEAVKKLNLDKVITTRSILLKVIKTSGHLTDRQKRTAIRVVDHLNGYKYDTHLSIKTIRFYERAILLMGYHFLYSDIELKPITPDMVKRAVSSDLIRIRL